eukprot:CAMPEP_0183292124 /NCGR_PEP_ID=MMETSP0160_2-20130417/1301_1 /TAXON_ID=2839 ORGANISM="Odontella Sinensis, Strain Grunow 1884" /NCGR_SAMPLE_ID=MMETSP0160_2 /ASSEMBLY_ACC=CAM_ASM_000250 /LENGTH=510 /DNA_ID=CAMNT_0025453037 /DNA_START=113 /DNA_END=1645 /DNA_ORIENTATION=-
MPASLLIAAATASSSSGVVVVAGAGPRAAAALLGRRAAVRTAAAAAASASASVTSAFVVPPGRAYSGVATPPTPLAPTAFPGRDRAAPSSSSSSSSQRHQRVRPFSSSDGASPALDSSSSGDGDADAEAAAAVLTRAFSDAASAYALPPPPSDVMTDLEPGRRIVSFGDVHGDADALKTFLVIAGVMDPESDLESPVWTGGTTICVQTGDILDRGDDELKCYRALCSLSRQALAAGGALMTLYGNHESLNCAGLFQYANPGGNLEFEVDIGTNLDAKLGSNRWRLQYAGNQPSRWAAFEPGGLLAEELMGGMAVSCVVGRTVFVHAGLTREHLENYGGIEGMNRQARSWMKKAHHHEDNPAGSYETVEEVISSAQRRARAISGNMPECLGGGIGAPSPVWMRDYSQPADLPPKNPMAQKMIDDCLEELGQRCGSDVVRMVMGHTPQSRINAALNGRAWRVDVGASRGVMGGAPEVLEIVHGADADEVSILTVRGERINARDRQVVENILF